MEESRPIKFGKVIFFFKSIDEVDIFGRGERELYPKRKKKEIYH